MEIADLFFHCIDYHSSVGYQKDKYFVITYYENDLHWLSDWNWNYEMFLF